MEPLNLIKHDYLGCDWDTATYFLFSENVGEPLVYYSHLLPAIAGLILAAIILMQSRQFLINKVIVFIAVAFSIFSLFDLVLWATERPSLIMFLWSSLIYFEPLIYAATLYLVYLFVTGKDAPMRDKLVAAALMLPIFILIPTNLNLAGYDYTNCFRLAVEGPLLYYVYLVELLFVIWTAVLVVRYLRRVTDPDKRKQIILLAVGSILFLLSFSWGNITGTLLSESLMEQAWVIAQYGFFGMPIFLGFMAYLIVRYQAFNVKLLSVEALVISLWVLLASLLFLQTIESARPIIVATLILFTVLGGLLVRSVRREIHHRERIEELADNLRRANARLRELDRQKTEFVSIASHQLRSPLTAINGYTSLILEGSFGPISGQVRDALKKVFQSGKLMVVAIDDFLNVTRIEQGRMKYDMTQFDLVQAIEQAADEFRLVARDRNLDFRIEVPDDTRITVHGDRGKIMQVVTNLVDNSLKYTKEGFVAIKLRRNKERGTAVFEITDTGIGIPKAAQEHLFQKFGRAENANKASVHGTGLGLYIAKQMVLAHNGEISVDSEGEGKGTTATVEIPLAEGER